MKKEKKQCKKIIAQKVIFYFKDNNPIEIFLILDNFSNAYLLQL